MFYPGPPQLADLRTAQGRNKWPLAVDPYSRVLIGQHRLERAGGIME